jgi:type IV pilus assembly protein PilO
MRIDLNDITLDSISVWPAMARNCVLGACCLIVLLLGYFLDLRAEFTLLSQTKQQEAPLKQEYEYKSQQAANLEAYRKQLQAIKKNFAVLLQKLPESTEVPGLLEDISKVGVASGLEFTLFKPQPENPMDFYAELPIQITVRGTYHQFGQFVSHIAAMDRIVTLHDFMIAKPDASKLTLGTTSDPHMLEMNITAKTYRYIRD